MAVTHPTAVRNGIADFVVDQVDGGTTNPQGDLLLQTAGESTLATLNLSNPAFGAAAAGVATAAAISDETNATAGTATIGKLVDRDGTEIVRCSVGATGSGEDIELSSNVFSAGDTVRITSLTYTAPL